METIATQIFRLPDLGEGLTEAELVQWLVAVGDAVRVDQPIAEVETAKSIVELPSPFAGTVTALHGAPGGVLTVGAPVLEVAAGAAPEAAPAAQPAPVAETPPAPEAAPAARDDATEIEAYRAEERAGSGNVLIGYGTSDHGGARRRRPRRQAAPAPIPRPEAARRPPVRSPLVRRLARDLGIDVTAITPTGADGAVTRADVLRAAHAAEAPLSGAPQASTPIPAAEMPDLPVAERQRMSMLRRAASATFTRSRSEIPEATVWVDVDATELWRLRPAMAAPGQRPPSFTALLARFVLLALRDHPVLAGRLDGEEIVTFEGVNLGVATDTERGLVVPVLPLADRMSVAELDAAIRRSADEARAGKLPPERLKGSTFTLNNYGAFGLDGSAAIINHPEVAILGVGRVLGRPWVVDGVMQPRRIAQLSLVFDHRVCDGGYAARFLRQVVDAVESPLSLYGRL
jgi:pyruvate dehydrogenase E2 component (dihydrolipoamide acetyltransferase)